MNNIGVIPRGCPYTVKKDYSGKSLTFFILTRRTSWFYNTKVVLVIRLHSVRSNTRYTANYSWPSTFLLVVFELYGLEICQLATVAGA
jgi:hypothetical protein